ncbi:MAG: hypothetical protein AB9903_08620 [Vulcanimicrobiota bacterium]
MISAKYNAFRQSVKKNLGIFKKHRKITEEQLDQFTERILADHSYDVAGKVYCRDCFAYVHRIEKGVGQLVAMQINSFGEGVFNESITRFCTPILMTVRAHDRHRYLLRDLRNALISIDEFYLGKHYCGSKGPLCNRDAFIEPARKIFGDPQDMNIIPHKLVYKLMNANYLCHHIAETAACAFGALHNFWQHGNELSCMSSGSAYNEKRKILHIDVICDYSGKKVTNRFSVPNYQKVTEDVNRFSEEYGLLEWDVIIDGEKEKFILPSGYQKAQLRKYSHDINIVTSQHLIEFILEDYFKLINIFVIASTYQTLEYLSRAMIARREKQMDEFSAYMKTSTFCMGYCPDRDLEGLLKKKEERFPDFKKEFAYSMFFRPPVLK